MYPTPLVVTLTLDIAPVGLALDWSYIILFSPVDCNPSSKIKVVSSGSAKTSITVPALPT